MADSISINCPHCSGALKLQNRKAVGKKVRCPKCQEPFVVELPDEPEDEFAPVDEFDSYSNDAPEEEEEYTRPARASSSKSKKGSKKKSKGQSSDALFPILVAGGVLFGLVLLGGGGYLLSKTLANLNDPKGNKLDLTYLHPDCEMFFHVRLADLINAPFFKGLANEGEANPALEAVKKELDIDFKAIQSLTVGTTVDWDKKRAAQPSSPYAMFETMHGIFVIRSAQSWNQEKFPLPGGKKEPATQGAVSYFRAPHPRQPGLVMAVYFPESTTAVMGSEPDVKLIIDQGTKSKRRREMDFINPAHQFLFAVVPQSSRRLDRTATADPNTPPQLKSLVEAGNKYTNGAAFGVTITDGIACEALVNCTGGQGAQNLKSSLDTVLADARKQLADAKAQMPAFFKETFAVGEQILNGIQTQTVGSIMTVTANVPGSAKNTFEQLGKTLAAGMLPTGPMPFGNRRRAAGGMTPGMMPPGAATPGLTPGAMPAGAIPPGLQPGMVPPGSASLPPGALPANPAQGAAQPAATPIGAFPGTVPTTSPTPPMPPMNVPKP